MFRLVLIVTVLLISSVSHADTEIVEIETDYIVGESESLAEARNQIKMKMRLMAAEQLGVYVEGTTHMKSTERDSELVESIMTLSSNVTHVTIEKEEILPMGRSYKLVAVGKVVLDPESFYKRLEAIYQNNDAKKQLARASQELKLLWSELEKEKVKCCSKQSNAKIAEINTRLNELYQLNPIQATKGALLALTESTESGLDIEVANFHQALLRDLNKHTEITISPIQTKRLGGGMYSAYFQLKYHVPINKIPTLKRLGAVDRNVFDFHTKLDTGNPVDEHLRHYLAGYDLYLSVKIDKYKQGEIIGDSRNDTFDSTKREFVLQLKDTIEIRYENLRKADLAHIEPNITTRISLQKSR